MTTLRELIARPRIVVMPGAYDALTAMLIQRAGFEAVYLSGAGVSYTHLARPDVGLVTLDEMLRRAETITDAISLPVLADGDTGFGNALNARRAVRAYERAGLAGIQLEDQTFPKRCGHLDGKEVIAADEMAAKIAAAADARTSREFVIVARTDAIATHGLDEALRRLRLYAESGADVVFADGPTTREELAAVPGAVGRPAMANVVEGGRTPSFTAAELEGMGYRLVIHPNSLVRLFARQGAVLLEALRSSGTTAGADMLDFGELNELLGTDEVLATGRRFAASAVPNGRSV